jgi:multiple sugar transport system permease protein
MGWQVVLGVALIIAATQVWQIETFFNLGNFIPRLIAGFIAFLGAVSLLTVPLLWTHNNNGRITAMILNFFFAVLAILWTLHLLGAFIGIDTLAEGVYRNSWLLLGFPIGYLLVWLSGRLSVPILQRVGLGIMGLAVVGIILTSGFPALLVSNPGMAIGQMLNPGAILSLVIAFVLLAVGIVLMRLGDLFGETILQREAWQGWLFLLPNFANFLLFFAVPLILSLYLSFTSYDAISQAEFIGLDNYTQLLSLATASVPVGATSQGQLPQFYGELGRVTIGANDIIIGARDTLFWESLGRTIRYCILLLTLGILPAFGLAMLLNSKIPGMNFFRAAYFLPSIAAVVGVAMIWQWLYNPVIGYINYAISSVVNWFNATFSASVTDPNIQWLSDENIMLISVVIMAAWQVIGFNTVILLAGLKGVPRDLIEASTVDGAGPWTRFRRIILPLLGPTTFFVIITTLISGMQAFSEMYTLFTNSVSDARLTVVYYLYLQGFQRFNMGYASATAWVLFAVIFVITLIQFRISRSSEAYRD